MYQFGFEKLEVWQDARKLTAEVYRLTENFPEREKFGLTNQLRRASVLLVVILPKVQQDLRQKNRPIFPRFRMVV